MLEIIKFIPTRKERPYATPSPIDTTQEIPIFTPTITTAQDATTAAGSMGIAVHARLFISAAAALLYAIRSLAATDVTASIAAVYNVCLVVRHVSVSIRIIVNAVRVYPAAQAANSVIKHAMELVSALFPVAMTVNADKSVKYSPVAMAAIFSIYLDAYHAVMMQFVTSAIVSKAVSFATAFRALIAEMDLSV